MTYSILVASKIHQMIYKTNFLVYVRAKPFFFDVVKKSLNKDFA